MLRFPSAKISPCYSLISTRSFGPSDAIISTNAIYFFGLFFDKNIEIKHFQNDEKKLFLPKRNITRVYKYILSLSEVIYR